MNMCGEVSSAVGQHLSPKCKVAKNRNITLNVQEPQHCVEVTCIAPLNRYDKLRATF